MEDDGGEEEQESQMERSRKWSRIQIYGSILHSGSVIHYGSAVLELKPSFTTGLNFSIYSNHMIETLLTGAISQLKPFLASRADPERDISIIFVPLNTFTHRRLPSRFRNLLPRHPGLPLSDHLHPNVKVFLVSRPIPYVFYVNTPRIRSFL